MFDGPDCLYWYAQGLDGPTRQAWGLYPDAQIAQLLPTIEAGEGLRCNVADFWGLCPGFDPSAWSADSKEWPIIDQDVPSAGRETIGYFDRLRCIESGPFELAVGARDVRVWELGRALVPEAALGMLEAIDTAAQVLRAGGDPAEAAVTYFGHVTQPAQLIGVPLFVDPRACPWLGPLDYPPGPPVVRFVVTWHLRLTGVASQNGPFPPLLTGANPRELPMGVSVGPGDWTDQRYAYGLPRHGAQQWALRGPAILRLLATVEVINVDEDERDVVCDYAITGRIQGFTQSTGSRLASIHNAIERHP